MQQRSIPKMERSTIRSPNVDVSQLPINSRSVSSSPLAALAVSPEVTRDSQGNIAVGGATAAQTGFSVDGISTANVRFNGALQDAYPSLESIDEMKVTAFNNNAEFAQIGDVTFTTKSGTNQLHGSGFEYFQNSALDATVLNFPVKAPRTFNTFGGSLGGPVTIPKLYNGRDKTFFFADYEGNRKTQSYPEELLVPSAADRAGNLNDLVQPLGRALSPNPFTGDGLPEQHRDPDRIVRGLHQSGGSGSVELLSLAQRQLGCRQPVLQLSGPGAEPLELQWLRCPHRSQSSIRSSRSTCATASRTRSIASPTTPASLRPANDFLPNVGANEQNRSLVVSYNYSITPTLVNEFRFGFANYNENDTFPDRGGHGHLPTRAGLRSSRRHRLASHGGCLPDLQFLRRLRYQHRAGQGWDHHFAEHAIHRQSDQDSSASIRFDLDSMPAESISMP